MIENVKDLYSYQDGNLFRLQASGGQKIGAVAGWETTCNGKRYKKINIKKKTYYLHQVIFFYHYGYIPKYIDHADGNSLNNKIENLRMATRSQNLYNCRISSRNTSGVKGVSWDKNRNKWHVQVISEKKVVFQKRFDDIELAEFVAIEARNKYHGKFARHT